MYVCAGILDIGVKYPDIDAPVTLIPARKFKVSFHPFLSISLSFHNFNKLQNRTTNKNYERFKCCKINTSRRIPWKKLPYKTIEILYGFIWRTIEFNGKPCHFMVNHIDLYGSVWSTIRLYG